MNVSKYLIALLFLLSTTNFLMAQSPAEALRSETPVAWLGIDFSMARFIGDNRFKKFYNAPYLTDELNELMVAEREKFDLPRMLGKTRFAMRINVTQDHNAALDFPTMVADSLGQHSHLSEADIESIVKNYDYKDNHGIGVMFNVETFNKKLPQALIWVTFVNMDTKEVILTERQVSLPGGSGLRNYWAGAVYHMMEAVRKSQLQRWQIKYSKK